MISVYCDEDVDVLIKPLLEAKGFKVFEGMSMNLQREYQESCPFIQKKS